MYVGRITDATTVDRRDTTTTATTAADDDAGDLDSVNDIVTATIFAGNIIKHAPPRQRPIALASALLVFLPLPTFTHTTSGLSTPPPPLPVVVVADGPRRPNGGREEGPGRGREEEGGPRGVHVEVEEGGEGWEGCCCRCRRCLWSGSRGSPSLRGTRVVAVVVV